MSPEIGDTDMLDPIVRAAAHPSRAILDAPARATDYLRLEM
jgi:hypothetical protein